MITETIQQLDKAKAKVAALEAKVSKNIHKELAALPAKYGFKSAEEFIAALHAAGGRRVGRPLGKRNTRMHKRAVITDETRAEVKRMVEAGKTGAAIARELGISLPSVQNIKKALGMVRSRK